MTVFLRLLGLIVSCWRLVFERVYVVKRLPAGRDGDSHYRRYSARRRNIGDEVRHSTRIKSILAVFPLPLLGN